MTLKSGTNQACAACKHQRRKCAPTCVLAPYFPADQHKVFLNVHKLFGVKKIQKLLHELPPSIHGEAMTSIIYQANMRDRDPVHGCLGVIYALENQYWQCVAELFDVQYMLNVFRQQHEEQQQMPSDGFPNEDFDGASQIQLGLANMVPISQSHSFSSSSSPCNPTFLDVKETLVNSLWNQQGEVNDCKNSEDEKIMPAQSKLVVTPEPRAVQKESFQDYDNMHPYFDTIDDRQSYVDTKEAYESRYITNYILYNIIHITFIC
ncbi:LOB domain-containing protein 27-like [Chenopodium quinoa]|uniref:LOB domain-containing protein 27-like n=1 Tax=Chenopodium quinoa TaxID=63459 RepID=UPI000B7995CA|nr:LOB domain-containing protein 27-like [Chenopodium quinoa]